MLLTFYDLAGTNATYTVPADWTKLVQFLTGNKALSKKKWTNLVQSLLVTIRPAW